MGDVLRPLPAPEMADPESTSGAGEEGMKEYMFRCPRFDRCSVNNCPLNSYYPNWPTLPDDFEKKCHIGKIRRLKIINTNEGKSLLYGGLTIHEYNAKKRWEALSASDREEKIARFKAKIARPK